MQQNCSEIIHRIKQMYSFEFAKDCSVKDFEYPFNIKKYHWEYLPLITNANDSAQ
jgi:hypothetical protein